MNSELEQQKAYLIAGNPNISLVKPCRIDDGILKIQSSAEEALINDFEKQKEQLNITFFVPASGSGSRMFNNLYDFLESDGDLKQTTYESVERLLNRFKDFAIYNLLPRPFKLKIKDGTLDVKELITFLLSEEGLNLGTLPKGLIPFHTYAKFMVTPFQEHIIQGSKIGGDNSNFHFTINRNFESKIERNLNILKEITGIDFNYTFSEQNKDTEAFTFDSNNNPVLDNGGNFLKRPAGHGALIENLDMIDADLIFIKNIDNIQHYTKAVKSIKTKKSLGGQLIRFQKLSHELLMAIEQKSSQIERLVSEINEEYQLQLTNHQVNDIDFIFDYFNRPIRICGMVPNEGQIGGGPFWIEDENNLMSKQIIEKSQISGKQTIDSAYLRATHFNPVEIICAVKDFKGLKFDLKKYCNNEQYFLVSKTHQGKAIKYIEKPGLWNGGMYNWLTLFYEIDTNCFSPVKKLTDLLNPLHLEKK
ncbi:MAG: DUF4301 family protein [Crocinitomicaceae bacterium]